MATTHPSERSTARASNPRTKIGIGLVIAVIVGLYIAVDASRLYLWVYHDTGAAGYTYDLLYTTHLWLLPIVAAAAIVSGWMSGRGRWLQSDATTARREGLVQYQSPSTFLEHWSAAIGGTLFAIGGILMGSVTFVPRFAWSSGETALALNIQFIGTLFLAFGVAHHVVNHWTAGNFSIDKVPGWKDLTWSIRYIGSVLRVAGKPEKPAQNLPPTQKISYVIWGILVGGVGITGVVMAYDMVLHVPGAIKGFAVDAHYFFLFLFIVYFVFHLGVKLLPSNWPYLKASFSGRIPEEYAKERHSER